MPNDSSGERRYSDREVAMILKRSAELQEAPPARRSDPSGLSLSDLEAAAAEAGLDPALVRQAAAEHDALVPQRVNSLLGAPTTLLLERVVEGEVGDELYHSLVAIIRDELGDAGLVSSIGRTLMWTAMPPRQGQGRSPRVTITPSGRRTVIRIEEGFKQLAGGLFGGLVGGIGGAGLGPAAAIIATQPGMIGVAAIGGWAVVLSASYLTARALFARTIRRRTRELGQLADRLAASIAENAHAEYRPIDSRRSDTVRGEFHGSRPTQISHRPRVHGDGLE